MRKIALDDSRGKFAEQDLQLIQLLERDEESPFWELVDKAREELGVVDGSYLEQYKDELTFRIAQRYARKITDLLDLPNSWLHPLADYIAMNKFYSPGAGIYLEGMTKDEHGNQSNLKIVVSQKLAVSEMKMWIEQNKDQIREQLELLPKKKPRLRTKVKAKLRMFELSNQGKTPKQILEKLNVEFPNLAFSNVDISDDLYELRKLLPQTLD